MSLAQVLQIPFAPSLYGQPGGCLLQSLASQSTANSLGLVADDQIAIQLYPRVLSALLGAASTTLQLTSGSTIVFSIKSVAGLGGSTLLGQSTGFTEYQDGSGNWYYGSILELTATAVTAALGTNQNIPCLGEIRITDALGNTLRYQFDIILYEAVYEGTEAAVSTPAPGQSLTLVTGSQAITAGVDNLNVSIASLGLTSAPAFIRPIVLKANGTEANIEAFLRAGWTAGSFTVDFDAVIPDGTFTLAYLIAPSSGSVGTMAVPAGVDTLTVPLTLPRTPTLIDPILVKVGGDANIRAFLRAGWTGAGFTVDFNANTPDATYVLSYLLVP